MKNKDIKIKQSRSSLAEFVRRPVASEEEAEAFDQYAESEARCGAIDDSLEQIYRDDQGNKVDVKKLQTGQRRGWLFNLFIFLIVAFTLGGALYGSYNYVYLKYSSGAADASISIEGKREVAAGEEFYYVINYNNSDKTALNQLLLTAIYPAKFIFLSAEPQPDENNNRWNIGRLESNRGGAVKIKGKLAGSLGSKNIILADLAYLPDNFSSEFKKSASVETKINDLGLDFNFINFSSAAVGEENELTVKFKAKNINYIDNFKLTVNHPPEVSLISGQATASGAPGGLKTAGGGADQWLVGNLGRAENIFKIKFKITEKRQPTAQLKLIIEFPGPAGENSQPEKYYLIYEKDFTYDVIKSDLNINLVINGSAADQGVDFGQTSHYSVNYKNTGDSPLKDVIIMAILESDFLNWNALDDKNNGRLSAGALSWSKAEIPRLAELSSGESGVIDFSLPLKTQQAIDMGKNYQVKSYIKYSVENKAAGADNQSNVIINKINSDLNLNEQIRYFNDDNIAVGYGPLPPKAGQITGFKVYWTVSNNLHELSGLKISSRLPAGVSWDGKNRASAGSVDYDPATNQVSWNIGRLPLTVYQASAEFNLTVAPGNNDKNKIMALLTGTALSAVDTETGMPINKTLKAKTTKLEDDPLADTDGVVQ